MKKLLKQVRYDKISDDLCILGFNAILRFNVTLSKPTQEGKRQHYHQEYEYNSNKYIDMDKMITIRRQFDFYMTIENIRQNDSGIKEFIMIRIQDILYVRDQLHNASRWFRDREFQNLFALKNNKHILIGNVNPIVIEGLANEKYLKLEPTVLHYNNDTTAIGVRLSLSAPDNYVDISLDKFMAVVYLIDSINMYESAQLLINYLQRPDLGTNLHSFTSRNSQINNVVYTENADFSEIKDNRREIGNRKRESLFDKLE